MTATRHRILLAEDDPLLRPFMTAVLSGWGYLVMPAENGMRALALFEEEGCDHVITDHDMPLMNGLALVRALRARGFSGRIIVISGAMSQDHASEYLACGVNGIGRKPIAIEELKALLSSGAVSGIQR